MTSAEIIPASPEVIRKLSAAPLSFKLAARVALNLKTGRLDARLPDGRILRFDRGEAGPHAEIVINDWRFARRILSKGSMGVAESYVDGDWDTPDLSEMLRLFSLNMDAVVHGLRGRNLIRVFNRLRHLLRGNSRRGARANIYAHYDLSNEFYALWLDPSMSYSAALFTRADQSLEDAQREKYKRLADSIGLESGDRVLEIGCGWGGFAEYATKERDAHVTGLTISPSQHEFARERLAKLQLTHKTDIRLQDYRDVENGFDKIASIEMFEAVGEKYWPQYFNKVATALKPGGRAGLQIITIREELFESYRRGVDFIQRHIFPGGMLPSVTRLKEEAEQAGLSLCESVSFGEDYAETLKRWRERFDARWNDICALSDRFDERFRRLWRYYLAYCEAGFRTGRIDVGQFTFEKAHA